MVPNNFKNKNDYYVSCAAGLFLFLLDDVMQVFMFLFIDFRLLLFYCLIVILLPLVQYLFEC